MRLNFLALKNLIKIYTVSKTPLGETGCLSKLYYLLAAQSSSFLIHLHFMNKVSQTTLVPYHLLCSNCVTFSAPCHVIGNQAIPTQPLLGKQTISLVVENILVS